jgi:FtsP/CotA-like multicopper oxidase with cupredoxin domain
MMFTDFRRILLALGLLLLLPLAAFAQSGSPCPRPAAGSVVTPPPELFSHNGVLNVTFNYFTTVDNVGRTLFCFTAPDGSEGPTLHVNPGDTLNISLTNQVPAPPPGSPSEVVSNSGNRCGDVTMTITSVNVHYHGTNTAPVCHSDEVIHTVVNSGESFQYSVHFPLNEPPGLYWYHPHIHGLAEAAVQGGATGAIIVEGIARLQPSVSGLPQRVLVVRDQLVAATNPTGNVPEWDVSVNYVPVPYDGVSSYRPSIIQMQAGKKEFWRVANTGADQILDLQLTYDGVAQPLTIVALDGVPVNTQDGSVPGTPFVQNHILIPPAGRAEFIVTGPSTSVKKAVLQTLNVDTGPEGDNDPTRPLATIQKVSFAPPLSLTDSGAAPAAATAAGSSFGLRFAGLGSATPTATRKLYFSEQPVDPNDPNSDTEFFITVDGATPTLFDPNNPPAITTTQGSVEDWTIENRTGEHHEFHMHQIHFKLLALNGVPVPASQQQYYDTYQVPFWTGSGPYPSIKVRMDFRGPVVGDFVYHCHILEHEDKGMMATIRVLPH